MKIKRFHLLAIVALGTFVAASLFLTPPRWVLRQLAVSFADSLMSGSLPQDTRVERLTKRVLGAYVQIGLASHLGRSLERPEPESDIEALARVVAFVRDNIVNQNQFRHRPKTWPAILAGAGYCDQINGAAAMLASRRFERAEAYALYDPSTHRSPHTIGRVWSSGRHDWLYFDAFFEEPVIFTKGRDGVPHFEPFSAPKPLLNRGAAPAGLYALNGYVLADFPSTFGGYLVSRLRTHGAQNAMSASYAPDPEDVASISRPAAATRTTGTTDAARRTALEPTLNREAKELLYRHFARTYVAARFDQLFGRGSREQYRSLALSSAAAADPRTARIARLSSCLATEAVSRQ